MRPTSFDPSALRQHLRRNKMADLPELNASSALTPIFTVFRKLKQLQYLASYTHRGRFYTLPEIARFDDRALWSHEGVWFSCYGTLLATLETFVNQSPNGYYAHELADAPHAEVQQPLRHLIEQQRLARMEVDGQFLYTAIESVPRRKQLLARRNAHAVPVSVHSAHILIAFLAYCLLITLKNRLQALAPGLTPKAVLEKLATIQMPDVWLPTTDGRWLVMPRFTQPDADQAILLHKLKLDLPQQPPPRIRTRVPEFPQEALRL
jgi:hypothetical protein